jgi:hypothetical protein
VKPKKLCNQNTKNTGVKILGKVHGRITLNYSKQQLIKHIASGSTFQLKKFMSSKMFGMQSVPKQIRMSKILKKTTALLSTTIPSLM